MRKSPSLTNRIAIGKFVGLVFGLAGFLLLPWLYPDADWQLRWGILFWYVTVGAIVGVFGIYTRHPVLLLPMPWWVRAPIIGAWMNFVLTFFAFETMERAMAAMFGVSGPLSSPFWFVLEGALVGAIIGFFATWFAGEGRDTIDM